MSDTSARDEMVLRFKTLTEHDLPARAKAELWPLRLDHCFKRVCLDWACKDCWYRHIRKPAEAHIDGALLAQVVQCAEEILRGGAEVLQERNAASLRWRGKLIPREPAASHR